MPPDLTPAEIERLACLAEEAAELIQIVGKVLRHGYESRWPPETGVTNRELMLQELADVFMVLSLMVDCGDLPEETFDQQAHLEQKLEKLKKYTHHQTTF